MHALLLQKCSIITGFIACFSLTHDGYFSAFPSKLMNTRYSVQINLSVKRK
jgi:hypothetical protein